MVVVITVVIHLVVVTVIAIVEMVVIAIVMMRQFIVRAILLHPQNLSQTNNLLLILHFYHKRNMPQQLYVWENLIKSIC